MAIPNSIAHKNGVWRVELSPTHQAYSHVNLKRRHGDDLTQVVYVRVDRLAELMARDDPDYVVGPVSSWPTDKQQGIREFLDPADGMPPEMAQISPAEGTKRVQRKVLGIIPTYCNVPAPAVTFTNGRHRTRYLYEAGAVWLPIEVFNGQVAELSSIFGAAATL